MITELNKAMSACSRDLLAREEMGLLDLENINEPDFFSLIVEVASEHIEPEVPELREFDLLVGAIISGYFGAKALAKMADEGTCPCQS